MWGPFHFPGWIGPGNPCSQQGRVVPESRREGCQQHVALYEFFVVLAFIRLNSWNSLNSSSADCFGAAGVFARDSPSSLSWLSLPSLSSSELPSLLDSDSSTDAAGALPRERLDGGAGFLAVTCDREVPGKAPNRSDLHSSREAMSDSGAPSVSIRYRSNSLELPATVSKCDLPSSGLC